MAARADVGWDMSTELASQQPGWNLKRWRILCDEAEAATNGHGQFTEFMIHHLPPRAERHITGEPIAWNCAGALYSAGEIAMPDETAYNKVLGELRAVIAILMPGEKTYDGIVAKRDQVFAKYQPVFSMGHVANLSKEAVYFAVHRGHQSAGCQCSALGRASGVPSRTPPSTEHYPLA